MDEFASLQPLEGGWSGETFVAEAGGERSVVRIYARPGRRGAAAHEVDAALLSLVRGLLPVPQVLEVRRADAATGAPALLVTEFLAGVRGDLLLPTLDDRDLQRVGESCGRIAATLGGMPMLRPGTFVDGDLAVEPLELGDLPRFVDAHAYRLAGWSPEELAALGDVAEQAQALLEEEQRTCLVHGDLNPKNLLLDPESLEVTGVLDWEFAHAGHPFFDLGNLVRFDRESSYLDAVLRTYGDLRATPPARALDLARAADLYALVELAARAGENPVATRAAERLHRIAGEGDVHAA